MLKRTDKVLCVCDGGNSRSVALAWIFKNLFDMDALACGLRTNKPETLAMLVDWADKIILSDKILLNSFPERLKKKIKVYDVGPDTYFKHFDDRLVNQFVNYIHKDLT